MVFSTFRPNKEIFSFPLVPRWIKNFFFLLNFFKFSISKAFLSVRKRKEQTFDLKKLFFLLLRPKISDWAQTSFRHVDGYSLLKFQKKWENVHWKLKKKLFQTRGMSGSFFLQKNSDRKLFTTFWETDRRKFVTHAQKFFRKMLFLDLLERKTSDCSHKHTAFSPSISRESN